MSIFDVFRSKWSAKLMSEHDRRKFFWYTKRKTSYTAWKARADAFDKFAEIFERQVREEPLAVRPGGNPEWGTDWEGHFPDILKAQVAYEQGLARLLQGDRTVWLYNELGVLHRAEAIEDHWFVALVNHGPHGDIYFEGKYVSELTDAIMEVSRFARATAGVVQPVWEDPLSVEYWSREVMAALERDVPFPNVLGEVPTPANEVIVRTGEPVPYFGIYEPLVRDGCMNYLLEGALAPQAANVDEGSGDFIFRPAGWRLLWKDERYIDGVVPLEENAYFPPTRAELPGSKSINAAPMLQSRSRQIVTKSGVWVVADQLNTRRSFEAGELLPEIDGREVQWIWVDKA